MSDRVILDRVVLRQGEALNLVSLLSAWFTGVFRWSTPFRLDFFDVEVGHIIAGVAGNTPVWIDTRQMVLVRMAMLKVTSVHYRQAIFVGSTYYFCDRMDGWTWKNRQSAVDEWKSWDRTDFFVLIELCLAVGANGKFAVERGGIFSATVITRKKWG